MENKEKQKSEKQLKLDAVPESTEKAINYISKLLDDRKVSKKEKARTMLIAEETIVRMIEHSDENSVLVIESHGFLGNINLRLKNSGSEFDVDDIEDHLLFDGDPGEDNEFNNVIHSLVERVFWDRLSIRNQKGQNRAEISVTKSSYSTIVYTLGALAIGILVGILLKMFTSDNVQGFSTTYIFDPLFNIFMNALKMMIGPLVFCSIASSIAEFTDLRTLGKIAVKVICAYLITSAIAIFIGYMSSFLLPDGNPALTHALGNQAESIVSAGETTDVSILGTIVNIVPIDIISPFQKSDMLQIIFLAAILGVTGAALANRIPSIRRSLSVANNVCSTIVTYLVKFVPLVVFCSVAKMVLNIDLKEFKDVLFWLLICYLGCILMICVYLVLLLVVGRVNPFTYLKKFFPAILTAFSTSSSNATLPTSLNQCDELGISRKVSSFSLPLGATINMDGSCVTLVITAVFMAGIYGVSLDGKVLMTLFISIMALSIGCPGIPGSGLVCMAILFPQIGVPAEAVAIIMGLYPVACMMLTATNVTGDAVVTTIIARQSGMLNRDKYKSK
ncbi:MAG: dicarboxylate/amino acid:cation symporter [Eubacterium sp.]|nr:dicarboxylate/amino acid:cation symporter [Eubacterium sp.]